METKLYKEPTAWVATEQWLGWVGLIAQIGLGNGLYTLAMLDRY